MKVVKVEVVSLAPIEFVCLDGYEPTKEQITWITELFLKDYLSKPVSEIVNQNISMEEDISWQMYYTDEEEALMEELEILDSEISGYMENYSEEVEEE